MYVERFSADGQRLQETGDANCLGWLFAHIYLFLNSLMLVFTVNNISHYFLLVTYTHSEQHANNNMRALRF